MGLFFHLCRWKCMYLGGKSFSKRIKFCCTLIRELRVSSCFLNIKHGLMLYFSVWFIHNCVMNKFIPIYFVFILYFWLDNLLKLIPSENCLADFCTSALLKGLKANLLRRSSFKNCRSPLEDLHKVSNQVYSWRKDLCIYNRAIKVVY